MIGSYSKVKLPTTGGSNVDEPIWKKLGYHSAQEYMNAQAKNKNNNKNNLGAYALTDTGKDSSFLQTDNPVEGSKEWWNNYYDDQKNTLLENYSGAQEKLDTEKKQAQQNASIAYDRLKKYLPMQLKAQGLGGLGVSESAMIQAQNNYINQMGNIGSEYSANVAELESNKTNALSELENYRVNKIDSIHKEETAKEESRKQEAVNSVKYNVELYEADGNYQGALTYLEANKSSFDNEADYNAIHSRLTDKVAQEKEEQEKSEQAEQETLDKRIIAEGEAFEYGGKYYKIGERLNSNANEIAHNNDFKDQIKAMGYSGAYDSNIPNGTTVTVKSDAYGANEVNWRDFVGGANPLDFRNWIPGYNVYNALNNAFEYETRTLTYYNGQWYRSSEVNK